MPIARLKHCGILTGLFVILFASLADTSRAAGVTLITHGNGGTTSGWVTGMANALSDRVDGDTPIYRIDVDENTNGLFTTVAKISGGNPLTSTHGEVILMLDWRNISEVGEESTLNIAAVLAPLFSQTNFISELGGHALAEFPIHLAGHSRGGSLVCELSKQLGEQGIWVDQVTNLDTYPVSGDAPADSYENVLFTESYYQKIHALLQGDPVHGSFSREQTEADGGYFGFFGIYNGHSDVHLWYHGTIDLGTPASDTEESITGTMRNEWWTTVEEAGTNAGYSYTRLAGGDRLSTVQPNGDDSTPVRDGFNRYFDVGGGSGTNNRTALMSNSGDWPNAIRFELLTTNQIEHGETAVWGVHFQWAQPNTSTQLVQVLADPDRNPFNGNEIVLTNGFATGTTAAQVGYGTIEAAFEGGTVPAGSYQLAVKMTDGQRSRFLYATQSILLSLSTAPLVLDIVPSTGSTVILGINGVAGQTAIVEMSVDGSPWLPVATNTLTTARWESAETIDSEVTLTLFRALPTTP